MEKVRKSYPTDMTEEEWKLLKPLFHPWWKARGRGACRSPERTRECLDAIRYILQSGAQWRLLPHDFPPRSTVHDAFVRWSADGTLARANDTLCRAERERTGRSPDPSIAILDSQSVKCADTVATGSSGYDGAKQIKGRKRHLLVDSQGLVLGVHVGPASTPERAGAKLLACLFLTLALSVTVVYADGGYAGAPLAEFFAEVSPGLKLEMVQKEPGTKGFKVLPRRWVVERTFGWLMKKRRLARDYERNPRHSEGFIHLAMIGIMAKRLCH